MENFLIYMTFRMTKKALEQALVRYLMTPLATASLLNLSRSNDNENLLFEPD